MKLTHSSIIALLLVIVCFVSFTRIYSDITLNKEQMEALDGQEIWWGDYCTCYYWSTCDHCTNLADYDYPDIVGDGEDYYSSYCEGSNSQVLLKKTDSIFDRANCDEIDWYVDCGDHHVCVTESCSWCTWVEGCQGCAEASWLSDECPE